MYAESSRLIIDSAMQLLSNVAEDSGGAFYLSKGSSLSTKNSILFDGNSAGAYGGTRMYVRIYIFIYIYIYPLITEQTLPFVPSVPSVL